MGIDQKKTQNVEPVVGSIGSTGACKYRTFTDPTFTYIDVFLKVTRCHLLALIYNLWRRFERDDMNVIVDIEVSGKLLNRFQKLVLCDALLSNFFEC